MTKKGKWTEPEITYLKQNYLKIKPSECAIALNRTVASIYQQATNQGIRKQPRYFDYELNFIKDNYAKYGPSKLSEKLDRSTNAIRDMAVRLGLETSKERRVEIAKETRSRWTYETRSNHSKSQKKFKGPLSHSWKGGICNVSEMIRGRLYTAWSKYVFQRDDYTCRLCGKRGGKLVVHHIRTFVEIRDTVLKNNPNLSIDNYEDRDKIADLVIDTHELKDGITLCRSCHKKHHLANGVNCGNILPDNAGDNPQPNPPKLKVIVGGTVQRLMGEDTATNTPDTNAPLLKSLG